MSLEIKTEIKKLQKMIAGIAKHSIKKVTHSSSTNVDEIATYDVNYTFYFSIKTKDNNFIRKVRTLVRDLRRQTRYLSLKYDCSAYLDIDEYERCPPYKDLSRDDDGFVRGHIVLTIRDCDDYLSDNATTLYKALS